MACSNGCGTSCSTDCTHSSSGGCGGSCGGSCSTNCTGGCSGYCDGTCKGGSGSTCSDCTAKCANDCTGACTNACVTGCTGCGNNCDGDCTSACAQRCSNDCNAACTATCAYDCEHTCTASCANDCTSCGGSCSSNCSGNCDSGCYTGCYGCDSTCSGGCSGTCNTTCTTTCANDCTGGCKGTCTGGCGGSCDNSCGFSCEASCDNNCTAVCSVSSVYGGNSEKSVLNFAYTGKAQSVTLEPGKYVLECWGAQGGNGSSNGNSNINAVGGLGGYSVGTITLSKTQKVYIYSGGKGQTKSNTGSYSTVNGGFNGGGSNYTCGSGGSGGGGSDIRIGTDSLYARVIVAGGGSGTGWTIKGAAGGGILGLSNYNSSYNSTQTAGGIAYTSAYNIMPTAGTFGIGGNGSGFSEGGSGGGGGWYGGGGAGYTGGSSGGSGYVYTSVTASNYPNGCLLNSSYYLSNAQTIAGDQSFPAPSGSTETGHSGNGYCRITCYVKKKTLHCKMNNEIKKAAPVFMKMNNKIYDAGANAVMDFAYTGTAQAISLPRGKYIIECWGAQGGSYSSYYGGAGGYSVGTITLTKNSTDLYIYVGGQPEATTSTGETPGGFNGGGKGCSRTYNYSSYGQGGGGATDVRIGKNDLYARVIVAGGGGGSSSENSLTTKYGGGTTGGSSASGYGATQTAAGTNGSFGQGGSATTSGTNYNYGSGGGGGGWYGGGACSDYSDSTNYQGYNGGGSGYVYTSATAANYPSGNYVNSSYYLTNAQTIAGNQSFKSPDGTNETGHTGNGFCRITRKSGKIFVKQNGSWIKV